MRSVSRKALLLLCLFCQSCVTYNTLRGWSEYSKKYLDFVGVQAVVSDPLQADSQKLGYLSVSYYSTSKWPRKSAMHIFAIPCKEGLIPEALEYKGIKHDFHSIVEDISEEQLDMIQGIFSSEAEKIRKGIPESQQYVESRPITIENDQMMRDWKKHVYIVPYYWNQNGGPAKGDAWMPDANSQSRILNSKCKALIIPNLPKKKWDSTMNTGLAVFEAPFAVAADVVLSPLELLLFIIYPRH